MKSINAEEWRKFIESAQTDIIIPGKEEAKAKLKQVLVDTIKKQIPDKKFGVLFSGGVDSTTIALMCKQLGADFTCYSIGFREGDISEPQDVVFAKKLAKQLDLNLKAEIYDLKGVEKLVRNTVQLLGKQDVVTAGVGAVVYAGLGLAKKDGITAMFSGLGSEELFAGYQRHELAYDVQEECWTGLFKMYERDLTRDLPLGKHFSIDVLVPFLEYDVIKTAMTIPASFKLTRDNNKMILREVAAELGVPDEVAFRKKKAAQYGSNFDKAIKKLAKKAGFAYKSDYLNTLLKR